MKKQPFSTLISMDKIAIILLLLGEIGYEKLLITSPLERKIIRNPYQL